MIHQSDRGGQYISVIFGKRFAKMGVRLSKGTLSGTYDNAITEKLEATLECELTDRHVRKTHTDASLAIFTRIEAWYNPSVVIPAWGK